MRFQKTLYYVVLILVAVLVSSIFAAPTIDSFSISPASPNVTSNLTTAVASTSPEGFTVSYAYNWYVNGITTTLLNLPFTNNSNLIGNQSEYDFSGNGLTVQLGNTTKGDAAEPTIQAPSNCKVGTYYMFDGADYMQVNDSNILNISSTQSFTVSLWAKTGIGGKYLFAKGDIGATRPGYGAYFASNT